MSSMSCLPLAVPRSLFETRGWGGMPVRQGSQHPSPLRVAHPNVQEHNEDRMSRSTCPNVSKHNEDRMLCSHGPVLPPEVPRNKPVHLGSQPVTAAGRQRALRLCTPSTPPPNTSQPPYRPAGHGCPKGRPERHGGPKGFGRRGPRVQLCVFGVSAVWPVGISAVWPVGVSALCRLDSRRVALPHFTR